MTEPKPLTGQIDIFEALGVEPPPPVVPPFTVYTSPYGQKCGWCGGNGMLGGGGTYHPEHHSIFFQYCTACHGRYGHPNTRDPAAIVVVDNRKDTHE